MRRDDEDFATFHRSAAMIDCMTIRMTNSKAIAG
jgi:hypothetical protein